MLESMAYKTPNLEICARAFKIVSEKVSSMGFPSPRISHGESEHSITKLYYCNFKDEFYNEIIHLNIAMLTRDGELRFLIPNNRGNMEVIDLKGSLDNLEKLPPQIPEKPPGSGIKVGWNPLRAKTPY